MLWTAQEILKKLNAIDESDRIEAKEAKTKLGKSARETICAFANEPDLGGGYLILGLRSKPSSDGGNHYSVIGVDDPDAIQREIASACRGEFSRPINVEVKVQDIDGKSAVVAFIEEAASNDKPIYIRKQGREKGAYRRIGPADFVCTDHDLDLLYSLRRQRYFESEVLPRTSYEDIDKGAIEVYRRIRASVDPKASELTLDDEQLLLSLDVLTKDREGNLVPTVAGLLLFGKSDSIRRVMPASRSDYIIVEGTKWVPSSSERYKLALEFWDPLVVLMSRLHSEVMKGIPMKFELKPGSIQRTDSPLIPSDVIREAIANALMHRDYRVAQPTQIINYSNRIEFRNAGYSLKSFDDLLQESGSKQRNPAISKVFHHLKFAETKGTGLTSMRENLNKAGFMTPPIIETDRARNQFDLILFPQHLMNQAALDWLSYFKGYNLSDSERRALAFVKHVGAVTNADYRQLNGADTLTASKGLSHLRDLGLLVMKGGGNGTFYTLPDDLTPHINPKSEGLTPHISRKSEGLPPLISIENGENGWATAIPEDFPPLPDALKEELSGMGKKVSKTKLKGLIKHLCSLGPLRLSQLSAIFARAPRYIRDNYLQDMIRSGELVYLYPEKPAHPKQAYKIPDLDNNE